jgi:divalent metal cation (Fe/Co/Zn/Cd) transporter
MNGWKVRQFSEAVQLFLVGFVAIGLLWMGLEQLIYGEVQPRIVDDLVSLAWSAMAWCAYYLSREHEKRVPRI